MSLELASEPQVDATVNDKPRANGQELTAKSLVSVAKVRASERDVSALTDHSASAAEPRIVID